MQNGQPPLDERFNAMITAQAGGEAAALIDALDTLPVTSILLNPRKHLPPEYFDSSPVPWCPSGRFLAQRPIFQADPMFHAGAYYVQDSSSMFIAEIIRQFAPDTEPVRALDLCAAPGGKSAILLSGLQAGSLVVSNEVNPSRWEILQHNLDKWGCANVASIRMDPSRIPWTEQFDIILVDAPCSGEGLFQKDPVARSQWSPDLVALCSARQRRILQDACRLLKPKGLLVYATCTFNDRENIDQVAWLADQYQMECLVPEARESWQIETVVRNGCTGLHFFPHKVPGTGFFCSVLQKRHSDGASGKSRGKIKVPKNGIRDVLRKWISVEDDTLIWIRESPHAGIEFLYTGMHPGFLEEVRRVRYGTIAGHFKNGIFSPSHALALSTHINPSLPFIEVDREQALMFLKKEPLQIEMRDEGWYVVRYHGVALGWMKQTGSGSKNYYPTHLRIR